ncbi:MAG: hypothetical protein ACUZ8O_16665 [Candidatus Anammoxibacter sp.]
MEETKKDWRDIFRAFRMAFDPKKLILGFIGVISTFVAFAVLAGVFNRLGFISSTPKSLINDFFFTSNLCPYELLLVFCKSVTQFSIGRFIALTTLLISVLAIWSIIGGAITRIAAMEYAKDESVRLVEAVKFAFKKFWSYFCSPLVPAIGVIFFALCNVLGGLVGKLGVFGDLFVAVGFPLALISSFMITFIGVIGIIGLCLMFPTISAEGSDAFDAMSRAYSYVLSKPRKYFTYFFVSTVYGIVCITFVGFIASLVVNITFDTVSVGMGQKFKDITEAVRINPGYCSFVGVSAHDFRTGLATLANWPEKLLALSILFSLIAIKTLVFGFGLAYLGSAKTIVYFLMRKDVDETEITDVYIEEETKIDNEEKTEDNKTEDKKDDDSSSADNSGANDDANQS